MPRHVDPVARRRDILLATTSVLAQGGMRGLSVRTVAERLGGSTTLVTHYYPTMKDLLDELSTSMVESWDEEFAGLERGIDDPRARLMVLLEWLLPVDEQTRIEESARINLLADELTGSDHRKTFRAWERQVRRLLRDHLVDLLPEDAIDGAVELLRVVINGVVLSAIEHPRDWPRPRQLAVVEDALGGLGLPAPTARESDGREARSPRDEETSA